jgi:site-specific recombinase XerC
MSRPQDHDECLDGREDAAGDGAHQRLDRWVVHVTKHAHVKRATIVTYSVHIRRWQARWGELRPGELTADAIRDWHAERAEAVTTARVKCEVNVLRVWLKWCVEHGWIDRVPALPKVGGVPKKIPRALVPEQLRVLFDTVRVDHRPQVRALEPVLIVGLHAGLRREEIRFLAWIDVDLDEGFLRVRAKSDAHAQLGVEPHAGEEGEQQQVAQGHVEVELDASEALEQRRADTEQQAAGDRRRNVVALQQRHRAGQPHPQEEHDDTENQEVEGSDLDLMHDAPRCPLGTAL